MSHDTARNDEKCSGQIPHKFSVKIPKYPAIASLPVGRWGSKSPHATKMVSQLATGSADNCVAWRITEFQNKKETEAESGNSDILKYPKVYTALILKSLTSQYPGFPFPRQEALPNPQVIQSFHTRSALPATGIAAAGGV